MKKNVFDKDVQRILTLRSDCVDRMRRQTRTERPGSLPPIQVLPEEDPVFGCLAFYLSDERSVRTRARRFFRY